MKNLYIKAQKAAPEIDFNYQDHELRISGQSYPEDSGAFYTPVMNWIKDYIDKIDNTIHTVVNFKIIYLNTSSSKYIMTILDLFEDAYLKGKPITINWLFDPNNDVAQESGEDFKEGLELPFYIVPDTFS